MAGRTSTLLNAEKGALLYQNNTTKQQIVTVNAVSNTATANPTLSLVLDTDANRTLNFEKNLYTLQAGAASANLIDLDILNEGANPVFNTQLNSFSVMGDSSGGYTSENSSYWDVRWQHIDPWMYIKPTDYGNPTDDQMMLAIPYSSTFRLYNNFKSARSGLSAGGLASYFNHQTTPANSDNSHSLSYYQSGVTVDHYTHTYVGVNASGYLSFGVMGNFSNAALANGNRSSDGFLYNVHGSSFDPKNYHSSTNSTSPFLSSDGGVHVINSIRWNSNTNAYLFIIPARGYYGSLPADKTQLTGMPTAVSDGTYGLNMPINTTTGYSRFNTPANAFQWMKYNKTNDKYYFCFKHSTSEYAGIWEWEWTDMTITANQYWGTTNNGPNGNTYYSHTQGSWKRVADYPLASTTDSMPTPSKIGANLWVSNASGDALYSTDLKTWKSSSDYFTGAGEYLNVNTDLAGAKFYVASGSSSVVRPVSGFEDIPAAGRLEYKTAVGNFSRNGLVINPGDCLYAENGDLAASLSISVMYLEV